MNWYIGQEIVAVQTNKAIKEGKTYFICGIRKFCCHITLDVGIKSRGFATCTCNRHEPHATDEWWLADYLFAPLADISELKEILETKVEEWGAGNTYPKRIIDL